MSTLFNVSNRHGDTLTLSKAFLTHKDLADALTLQNNVCSNLPSAEWFAPTTVEEFNTYFDGLAHVLGYKTLDGKLIALGIYGSYGENEHNYGYDLNIPTAQLSTIGQVECTIVDPSCRGFKLQQHLCQDLQRLAYEHQNTLLAATVFPENTYSLNTFLACGYTIQCKKIKYGGLRRYVLAKTL